MLGRVVGTELECHRDVRWITRSSRVEFTNAHSTFVPSFLCFIQLCIMVTTANTKTHNVFVDCKCDAPVNALKAYVMVVQAFLSVIAKWHEWSASCSGHFNLRETVPIPFH